MTTTTDAIDMEAIQAANRRHDQYYGWRVELSSLLPGCTWKSYYSPACPRSNGTKATREAIWDWHRRLDQARFASLGLAVGG